MVFSGIIFAVFFLPILLVLYTIVPGKFKNILLLLSSLFFYAWGEPAFLFVLLLECVTNFFLVKYLSSLEGRSRRKVMIFSVVFNLGFLVYFKYFNFFLENTNSLLDVMGGGMIDWKSVVLPIGISFYTFQSITYAVDVYRKNAEPQRYLHNYVLYSFLFPHLIAGPIVKYNLVAQQITSRVETANQFLAGFTRFSIGLGKKVLIANVLGEYSSQLLDGQSDLTSGAAWLGMLAYTFQIYFDFSGYSDMAIGLGKLFGFTFPENFDRPYTSRSITEFWKKWHITLGDFMKNYLYIPLGGNRKGAARTYLNLMIVFLLSGLWHGANWTFVLWGVFHGTWLILDRLFLEKVLLRTSIIAVFFTFIVVLNGWVLFQAESINDAVSVYQHMWNFGSMELPNIANDTYYMIHLLLAACICLFGLVPSLRAFSTNFISEQSVSMKQWAIIGSSCILFLVSLSFIVANGFNPFIYFKF
ncbi:MAG: MBOAT family protein [Cryomorphaceae bacterium]|nr:MBOAT family protein [Cryomorphaceae bacterium]